MKKIYVSLLFVLTVNSLFACLSASQNRLFPLGSCAKGLVVVETRMHRSEKDLENGKIIPAWSGSSYFKIYNSNYQEVYSELLDSGRLIEQVHLNSIVGRSFLKGLSRAEEIPGFVAAVPVSISFCDYQESCSKAALSFDTIANKINVRLTGIREYEVKILFDSTSVASDMVDYFKNYNTVLSADMFKGRIYINSVRLFKIGDKNLTIVHIGSGQVFERANGEIYPPGKEYEPEFLFNNLRKSVFEEPVLHHGQGFDFYIWEV